ncbi:Veg family protein, partial [Streptococcus pyogenes]
MSDAFTDVAKMKKIKEDIRAHEGQLVELTLENGRKREKNKIGRLIEVYSSL